MSAMDTFNGFLQSLGKEDLKALRSLIDQRTDDILTARSEEARVRVVTEFIEEAKQLSART